MTVRQLHRNRAAYFVPSVLLDFGPASPTPANDTAPAADGSVPIEGRGKPCPQFKWLHAANLGAYKGHHQGEFELTEATFAQMIANFRGHPKYKRGKLTLDGREQVVGVGKVAQFDFEHASEMAPWEGSIPSTGAPAIGWALDLDVRPGPTGKPALYVLAKLGNTIRRYIENEEYDSLSIAWNPAGVHPVTGENIGAVLTSVAFTNHPFVQDLASLAAAARVAGQVPRGIVQPGSTLSEAHAGGPPTITSGAMKPESRTRLCSIYCLMPEAADEAVLRAAENQATGLGSLGALLKALGFANAEQALSALPDIMAARGQLQEALSTIDGIMRGDAAADEAVQSQDVAAAFRARNFTDGMLVHSLAAHRDVTIRGEIAKLDAKAAKDVALVRAARERGRLAFLQHYGCNLNPATQHLTQTFVAGRGAQGGSVQVYPPLPAPVALPGAQPVTFAQPQGHAPGATLQLPPPSATPSPDELAGYSGRNQTEQIISYLGSRDPNFAKQTWAKQCSLAGAWRKQNMPAAA